MVQKKGAKKGGARKQRGSAMRQSGNGPISNFLGRIPLVGNMAGMPFKMVGLGRAPPKYYGSGEWGNVLAQALNPIQNKAINDLGNLIRRI